jgi:hypothetical protein
MFQAGDCKVRWKSRFAVAPVLRVIAEPLPRSKGPDKGRYGLTSPGGLRFCVRLRKAQLGN